jgi:hypothetical protein
MLVAWRSDEANQMQPVGVGLPGAVPSPNPAPAAAPPPAPLSPAAVGPVLLGIPVARPVNLSPVRVPRQLSPAGARLATPA